MRAVEARHSPLLLLVAAAALLVALGTAADADGDALLQLKHALVAAGGLPSWAARSAPCGARACTVGACPWSNVACSQQHVTHLVLSGTGLSGSLPADWRAPPALMLLDFSNNPQLCGSLPAALSSRAGLTINTSGSGLGAPCARAPAAAAAVDAGGSQAGEPAPAPSALSDLAKGMAGLGAGVGAAAAAVAGALLVRARRKRDAGAGALTEGNDLARSAHDSVVVAKHKRRTAQLAHLQAMPSGDLGVAAAAAGPSSSEPRLKPGSMRMVAFDAGAFAAGDDDGDEPVVKQRLRAQNIQDSVVIIRSRHGGKPGGPSSHGSSELLSSEPSSEEPEQLGQLEQQPGSAEQQDAAGEAGGPLCPQAGAGAASARALAPHGGISASRRVQFGSVSMVQRACDAVPPPAP